MLLGESAAVLISVIACLKDPAPESFALLTVVFVATRTEGIKKIKIKRDVQQSLNKDRCGLYRTHFMKSQHPLSRVFFDYTR